MRQRWCYAHCILRTCSSGKDSRLVVTKNYDRRAEVLAQLSVSITAAEAHGIATGLLCGQASAPAKSRWFTEILDAAGVTADAVHSRAGEIRELDSWFDATVAALNDADLGFEPAVPDDSAPLSNRAISLIDFCSGFQYGLGLSSAGKNMADLPADTKEVIADFQAIENLDLDAVDETDDDAWQELLEYVRVGVLLIHEELQPVSASHSPQMH